MSLIDQKYRIAEFNLENISQSTKPWKYKKQTSQQFRWCFEDFKAGKWWKNIMIRNFLLLILYLACHIVIQQMYQKDNFCLTVKAPPKNITNTNANKTETNFARATHRVKRTEKDKHCKDWAYKWFKSWNKKMKDMLKVITFLVGFYVSTMTSRWWEQVKGIPTPANICLQLGNVVKMTDSEALNFKKKILRYIHLSWTLVLTQRNKELHRYFCKELALTNKGLITQEEDKCLELAKEECQGTSYQNSWYLPLNWASIMIKKAKNDGKMGDPKEVLNDIQKFQVELGTILRHKDSKLPVVFSQAVWMAVWMWMLITLIGAQNTDHYTEMGARAHAPTDLVLTTLPGHELFTVLLICSWLQAADKLYNPFRENRGFSVNVLMELDYSLWRCSKVLQHSDLASIEGKIEFLELESKTN